MSNLKSIPTITEKGQFFMTFNRDKYWHESKNAFHCSLYDSKSPIHKVKVFEHKGGDYWAWCNNEKQEFEFVWPSKSQVEMCFPYAIEIYENRGDGRLVSVSVELIESIKS